MTPEAQTNRPASQNRVHRHTNVSKLAAFLHFADCREGTVGVLCLQIRPSRLCRIDVGVVSVGCQVTPVEAYPLPIVRRRLEM